ncbi:2475_t:CDS:2, partial [Diversispora eburnea]
QYAYISNVDTTNEKLSKLIKGGLSNFDCTMTKYITSKGKRNLGSHHILSASSCLTQEYKAEVKRLNDYYSPFETNMEMTSAEKTPYMVEWLMKIHKLIIEQNIHKDKINEMVAENDVEMRDGLDLLAEKCKVGNVPFLIFSAGLGKTGIFDHFKEPLIHTFNKSEVMIKDSLYYNTVKNRGNIILIGDSIGDLQMASGISHDICLSIGFYNKNDNFFDKYQEMFDIVVTDDGPMNVINYIMDAIIKT